MPQETPDRVGARANLAWIQAWIVPVLVVVVYLTLTLFTAWSTLRRFPNSADEYVYRLMASMFAEGRLSVPSPEPRPAFDFCHVLNDGRFYGKYPPGWPALLSVGERFGVAWLVNPALGCLTLWTIFLTVRRFFSPEAARLSLLCSLANPFLIFNGASYFSHPACHLFVVLFWNGYLHCAEGAASRKTFALMGAAAGAAFLIRPFSALALTFPAVLHLLWARRDSVRRMENLKNLLPAGIVFAILASLLPAYNAAMTGNAFLHPFTKYDPTDRVGIGDFHGLRIAVDVNLVERLLDLNQWMPLSIFFLAAHLIVRPPERRTTELVLHASVWLLIGAYFFYLTGPGNQYGPRYLYEASGALLLLAGVVLSRARAGVRTVGLVAIICMNIVGFIRATELHRQRIQDRMEVYDLAAQAGLRRSIVFLRTGSATMPPGDLTRNGIHFDGPVLYVFDRGPEANAKVARAFPDRSLHEYVFDPRIGRGEIHSYQR